MPAPLTGNASVKPLADRLPAAKAEWVLDAEAKTSTAALFGGTAVITRREDTGKFRCDFVLPDHGIDIKQPLNTAESLAEAQQRAEALIRNSMSKTHPEVIGAIEAAEAEARVAAAGKDPF